MTSLEDMALRENMQGITTPWAELSRKCFWHLQASFKIDCIELPCEQVFQQMTHGLQFSIQHETGIMSVWFHCANHLCHPKRQVWSNVKQMCNFRTNRQVEAIPSMLRILKRVCNESSIRMISLWRCFACIQNCSSQWFLCSWIWNTMQQQHKLFNIHCIGYA